MSHEPFDEHLSWELRSLVADADPPPTLRPATVAPTSRLPRPLILTGAVAAVIVAMLALLLSGGSGTNRQHVASQGKDHETPATSEPEPGSGVVVPVLGGQSPTQTTVVHGRPTTTAPKKSTPTTAYVIDPGAVARPIPQLSVTRYSLGDRIYYGIAMGPDGNMWTVSWLDVARITPSGQVTKFPYRSSIDGDGQPTAITAGPDGNLWFTEWGGDKVGRITTTGTITEFQAPACCGITSGPDGALWFSESGGGYVNGQWTGGQFGIGRITTAGQLTTYPTSIYTFGVTSGSDGNLWFAEGNSKIGRITTSGAIAEYPIPRSSRGVALGPDGNVWFQPDSGVTGIGRIAPTGDVKEFDGPGGSSWGTAITSGPDGNVWCVDQGGHAFRVDPDGKATTFVDPGANGAAGIGRGPNGTLWITDDKGVAVFKPPA